MRLGPSFEASETADRGDAPRPGLALLNTETGEVETWEEIQRFGFSGDGRWMARQAYPPKDDPGEEGDTGPALNEAESEGNEGRIRENPGTALILMELNSGQELLVDHVARYAFDQAGEWIAYTVASTDGQSDGLFLRPLEFEGEPIQLEERAFETIESLVWWDEGPRLAWVSGLEDEDGEAGPGTLSFWAEGEVEVALLPDDLPDDWVLPVDSPLRWSEDGERLFYGSRPLNRAERERWDTGESDSVSTPDQAEDFDPFDLEAILEEREVDVWHTEDPLINSNQKQVWDRSQTQTFRGVFHLPTGRAVQLGDTLLQLQGLPENDRWALATSDYDYRRERTWNGGAEDVYLVDLQTGEKTLVFLGLRGGGSAANSWIGVSGPSLSQSPGGRFVAWFDSDHWHLYDAMTGTSRTLTEGMDVPFFDVDHDYPNPRGGHGLGGWLEGDEAVLIHDKYDVWKFPTNGGAPVNLTRGEGRRLGLVLRVMDIDPETPALGPADPIHLASFDVGDKSFGFFQTHASRGGLLPLLDEEKRYRFLAKAEDAETVLFTREDYDEFPDLWVGDPSFHDVRKITDVNPGLTDRFAWGTSELVEWTSDDGVPLQGVVIKPGNYEAGKRYPVLTYFYRFFSQRLHEFNEPVINHRPSFPIYASDGYIVFLPDVRFEVGRPGISSLKSVVPGLKKLVDLGLADPDALGLHGHSWSGYTTAYIVTQTNLFAAAVAGAPVSNMTSAYGGIRWGTGLARQFQYEAGQSRLSGSLWEARPDYIENSPLFYADRVETPLVLMHGDEDEAVPWYQSIEFYLALRRTGKHAVFLQYRGEPHHPRKYANKLDYSMKMKDFFDHHLKGAPAPEWWSTGVLYSGR
jgi:dipeptidyl aminopeptidase/acylaminoacyl peptidase